MKIGDIVGEKFDGYRGIWYYNQPSEDEYKFKYSGGLGTYCAKHIPFCIYSKEVDKTFFCYGGSLPEKNELVHMVSYFDHNSREIPKPTALVNKHTDDAHDNPVLSIDHEGFIWVFSSSHGLQRPSYIFKSVQPYHINKFRCMDITNFSYPQPWMMPNGEFLFLHTRYFMGKRNLIYISVGEDGKYPEGEEKGIASIQKGHYQISSPLISGSNTVQKVGTAFNLHPEEVGLNARTNLYYLETSDHGKTWENPAGLPVETPLLTKKSANHALVYDFQQLGYLIYLKDINFDEDGNPIILFIMSRDFHSGPQEMPRIWATARWDAKSSWIVQPNPKSILDNGPTSSILTSDSNYDMGSLYIETEDERTVWKIVAPAIKGPQPFNPGGEVGIWRSNDQGRSWELNEQLTSGSDYNHTYVRRPLHSRPEFKAFWADGNARKPSPSRLYFYDETRGKTYQLPTFMKSERMIFK